jgi:hypothetical protein
MVHQFPVFIIPDDAAEATEAMGSRFKFWFRHPDLGMCLFKQVRANTGEDWAEKIAAELAQLLGLPHATYELAAWQNTMGVISPTFLSQNTALIHGNDILAELASNYPKNQNYGLSQHTLTRVLDALRSPGLKLPIGWEPPIGVTEPITTFVGYLLLDAWIGNGDRHHENWGFVIQLPEGIPHLAPTYDHASCLGRELLDSKRLHHIQAKTVHQYAAKARSALYQQEGDRKAMLGFDIFEYITRWYGKSAAVWLDQLAQLSLQDVRALIESIPEERMSTVAVEFSVQMLESNRNRLMRLRETLL